MVIMTYKGMENMWIILIIFVFIYHFVYSANDVSTCTSKSDCMPDQVCQDNICRTCINCQLLFRKGGNCENDFSDCEQCLPGYKEVSTTNYSNIIKPCRPENLKADICANDEDCPFDNFCYEAYCTSCFDCILFNKLPPKNGCAKNLNECGFCADGYYELPVTMNSELKSCVRKIELNNVPKIVWKIIILLPLCILFAIAAIIVKLIFRKSRRMEKLIKYFGRCYFALVKDGSKIPNIEQTVSPSAPPLFVLDIPEKIQCEEKPESWVPLAKEIKQQGSTARVFKQPTALYYFAEESADDLSDHSNDSNEEESSPPQRRNEQEETCSPSIFIHRYNEIGNLVPPQGISEANRQISVDAIDSASTSQSPTEDAPIPPSQSEDSNSSKP